MHTENNILIDELLHITSAATAAAGRFRELDERRLRFKLNPDQWNILECIEHLNRYGDYYLPALEKAILSGKSFQSAPIFKSGLIGDYFANLMKVKNNKIRKMQSPEDKNPLGSELSIVTIDRFLKQTGTLESLLQRARSCDLTKTKVPISLTRLIKLRLGDTLRFFVFHIERHILQAERMMKASDDGRPTNSGAALRAGQFH